MKRRRLLLVGLLAAVPFAFLAPAALAFPTAGPPICVRVHVIVGTSSVLDTGDCSPGGPGLAVPQVDVPGVVTPNDPPAVIPPIVIPVPNLLS